MMDPARLSPSPLSCVALVDVVLEGGDRQIVVVLRARVAGLLLAGNGDGDVVVVGLLDLLPLGSDVLEHALERLVDGRDLARAEVEALLVQVLCGVEGRGVVGVRGRGVRRFDVYANVNVTRTFTCVLGTPRASPFAL